MERVKSKNKVKALELVMTVIYKALAFSPAVICYLSGEEGKKGRIAALIQCGDFPGWRH